MPTPEQRLEELGITLPQLPPPVAAYIPSVRTGNLLYVSGQIASIDGKPGWHGRLGAEVSFDEAVAAARQCAVNVLAVLKAELGELSRVRRVVRVGGFVASHPDFTDQHKVINGASELIGAVFGETGRHARTAIGVAALPLGVPVEVDAIVEVD